MKGISMRVKDPICRYVIVNSYYYQHFGRNAFIEPQAQTNDYNEALRIKDSFENCDNTSYKIIDKGETRNGRL